MQQPYKFKTNDFFRLIFYGSSENVNDTALKVTKTMLPRFCREINDRFIWEAFVSKRFLCYKYGKIAFIHHNSASQGVLQYSK